MQTRMARNAYTYIHLPMIIGLILFSLGVKKSVGHPDEMLGLVVSVALCGGLIINLLAQVLFVWVGAKRISYFRFIAVACLCVLLVMSGQISSIVLLGGCTITMLLLVIIETQWYKRIDKAAEST